MNRLRAIKQSVNNYRDSYIDLANSLDYLMKISKRFYVTSIGFDEIFYGTKNPRRFKLCVFTCVYCWVAIIQMFVHISYDKIYSKLDGPFVPKNFKTIHTLGFVAYSMACVMKTEFLIGEYKYNLKPLRRFYCLMNNWKHSMIKHHLNNENYKRLAYLTRSTISFSLDFGAPILFILATIMIVKISILSLIKTGQLFWIFKTIHIIPLYLWGNYAIAVCYVIIYIYFSYYKLLFDQFNVKFKDIFKSEKWKLIVSRRQEKIINLIKEHYQFANEIYQLNLIANRIAAMLFITMSIVKNISLYLLIHAKSPIIRTLELVIFICFFFLGFALNHFLSKQIKSARQSQQLVNSILCKYKMPVNLRFKLSNFLERLTGPSIGLYCYDIAPCDIHTFYKVIELIIYQVDCILIIN